MNFKELVNHISQQASLVGCSTVVVGKDEIIDESYYGYQSLEQHQKVTADTIFRIASISKIIVAMVAMSLVEKGLVSLDDDIGDILGFTIRNPYYPNQKITMRMLMTQTSSITDGFDDENPLYNDETRGYNNVNGTSWNVSLKELLNENGSKYYNPLTYDKNPPGSKFIYSNFGCGILACIIEAITKQLFTDYVEKVIFSPLEIDASFRACNIKNKEMIASTYKIDSASSIKLIRSGASFVDSCYPIFPIKENYRGPAGGLFISIRDLGKIMMVFLNDGKYQNHQILSKSAIDQMLQLNWYGHWESYLAKGLQLKFIDFKGTTFKGHTGSAYGVISYFFFSKEENIGICFITNGGNYKNGRINGFYEPEEQVFKAFHEIYFPKTHQKQIFHFHITDDFGYVNNRFIKFPHQGLVENDNILLPVISILDGLNLVPDVIDKKIIVKRNSYTAMINNQTYIDINSVKELAISLGMKYTFENNYIKIEY